MTGAERTRLYRLKHGAAKPVTKPVTTLGTDAAALEQELVQAKARIAELEAERSLMSPPEETVLRSNKETNCKPKWPSHPVVVPCFGEPGTGRGLGKPTSTIGICKSSELSALIRVRDEINKEDQARWLAVVELSLFLTRAWADFLFPDKELPHARELMLVGGVIFIWDLKGKPLTETGVSRVIGMPRATLARRIDVLIKEGWVVRCRNHYYFDFDKFGRRQLSSHLRSLSRAITMAARRLTDPGAS
jgi:hypothetical protein